MNTLAAAAVAVTAPVVAGALLAGVRYVQRRQAHRRRVELVTRPPAKAAAEPVVSRAGRVAGRVAGLVLLAVMGAIVVVAGVIAYGATGVWSVTR